MPTITTAAEREVLDDLASDQACVDAAEIRKLVAAVRWADLHTGPDTVSADPRDWEEHTIPLAGPGAPDITEFCVPALAVALAITHDSASRFLGDAIELAHRLPRTYAQVLTGDLRVWKARRVAQATRTLSPPAAAFVDTHIAAFAAKISIAGIDRLVLDAITRYDPDQAEERRLAAAEQRCFDINLAQTGPEGITHVSGALDYADARDLETAVADGAAELRTLGSSDPVDVRRSKAVGVLARNQLTLDLNPDTNKPDSDRPVPDEPARPTPKRPAPTRPARQVVIHVHLADAALGTVEGSGCVSVEQVRGWCADTDTQVIIRPVIDLNEHWSTDAYTIPDRMREHVALRDPTCAFTGCTITSRRCDTDHIIPFADGGPTDPDNLAPLCRRHHRLKTHGGWTYRRLRPGVYQWTDPHGQISVHYMWPQLPPPRRQPPRRQP